MNSVVILITTIQRNEIKSQQEISTGWSIQEEEEELHIRSQQQQQHNQNQFNLENRDVGGLQHNQSFQNIQQGQNQQIMQ